MMNIRGTSCVLRLAVVGCSLFVAGCLGPKPQIDHALPEPGPEIRQAIAELQSPYPRARFRGAMALADRDATHAAVPALAAVLTDEYWETRKWAVMALTRIGGRQATDALVSHWLEYGGDPLWYLGGRELARLGEPVMGPARKALRDPRPQIRVTAVRLLGSLPTPRHRRLVKAAFLRDEDQIVRRTAAFALARMGGTSLDVLIANASHPDQHTRRAVANALSGAADPEAIPALLALLADDDPTLQTRGYAQKGLAAMAEQSFQPLLTMLESPDPDVRADAVYGLGGLDTPEVMPHLVAALQDDSRLVRLRAARALRRTPTPSAVGPLLAALQDESPGVVSAAAVALGRTGDRRAVEPLLAVLDGDESSVVGDVLVALADLGEERAVEPALRAFQDENSLTRARAAIALGTLRSSAAVAPLTAILLDRKELSQTRSCAASALGYIGSDVAVPSLIAAFRPGNPPFARAVESALIRIGQPAVPALTEVSKQGDANRRHWARATIAEIEKATKAEPVHAPDEMNSNSNEF